MSDIRTAATTNFKIDDYTFMEYNIGRHGENSRVALSHSKGDIFKQ